MPIGIRFQTYRPVGVTQPVLGALSGSISICQKPDLRSTFDQAWQRPILAMTSRTCGMGMESRTVCALRAR